MRFAPGSPLYWGTMLDLATNWMGRCSPSAMKLNRTRAKRIIMASDRIVDRSSEFAVNEAKAGERNGLKTVPSLAFS